MARFQQDTIEQVRPANSIIDDAAAIDLQLHLRDIIRKNKVAGGKISLAGRRRAESRSDFRSSRAPFCSLHHQIAVRENIRYARGQSGGESRLAAGGAFAVKLLVSGCV